jgi:hypothetical protein
MTTNASNPAIRPGAPTTANVIDPDAAADNMNAPTMHEAARVIGLDSRHPAIAAHVAPPAQAIAIVQKRSAWKRPNPPGSLNNVGTNRPNVSAYAANDVGA